MNIEKRDFSEIPPFIHELVKKFIRDEEEKKFLDGFSHDRDVIIAIYLDMSFRAGFQSAKSIYKKRA